MPQAYKQLEQRFARIGSLGQAQSMLHWDMAAMMPSGGGESRGEQLATLAVLSHELLVDAAVGDLIAAAGEDKLDTWQLANLAEMQRAYTLASALPSELVEAQSKAGSACEMVWRKARPDNDFKAVLPCMKEVFALTREEASILSSALNLSPYDSLLSKYEPGGRSANIDPVFESYAAFLPDFLQDVLDKQAAQPAAIMPTGPFTTEDQKRLGLAVMERLGFDFDHGRLDVSAHPFCGGTPGDVRITTRYDDQDFTKALMGVIHETGHALYERGLPKEWQAQPVGQARGMVLHESQSLLMEMQACRSPEFIAFVSQLAAEVFGAGDTDPAWQPANLERLYKKVEKGFIRVDADEVTYPAHVILRYRLEKALLSEDLQLEDLPQAWGDGLHSLLGIRPETDRDGCLQDIHWYDGAIGYFPTYSLGAMSAAQLFDSAKQKLPNLMSDVGEGNFADLLAWLRTNVHSKASSQTTDEIMTQATGKSLDPSIFKAHLRSRYLGV